MRPVDHLKGACHVVAIFVTAWSKIQIASFRELPMHTSAGDSSTIGYQGLRPLQIVLLGFRVVST